MMKRTLVTVLAVGVSACAQNNSDDKLRDPVPETGVAANIQVNIPSDQLKAAIAASVYKDRVKQPLVGGDVFVAVSDNDNQVLRSIENLSGNYQGIIDVSSQGDPVEVNIVHDADAAREDRWYPYETLQVDPGPGPLVGYTATVIAPAPVYINSPQEGSLYHDRSDEILLTWDPADGQQMRISSRVTCTDGHSSLTYGISSVLGEDDGSETLTVGSIIPNEAFINPIVDVFAELSMVIVATVLDAVTFGLINGSALTLENFDLTSCTIDLTLFREVDGQLDAAYSGGYAIGSTSDTVTITYQPEP